MKHYDYIFAGAGLAGLMTVYRMAVSGKFSDKKILLLDADAKQSNDRTWCYWQAGKGNWDGIVHRQWNTALFAYTDFSKKLDFGPYQYKMVRGIDFYAFVFRELEKHGTIELKRQKVTGFTDMQVGVEVQTETQTYTCNKLINSIYNPKLAASQSKFPVLQQHFIGWHVKTDAPVFDAQTPVFMDFSIAQKGNTRFMYVLPFSATEAILEYTLFSKDLLPDAGYEAAIQEYLAQKGATSYQIIDKERGSIPMTSYPFWERNTINIINIGSAGGWTKASTGYTFRNSDKMSQRLVNYLENKGNLADFSQFYKRNMFWFYDLLLLDILAKDNHKGAEIFSAMFRKGSAAPVFKFLDEETTLADDLGVIWRCPKAPFLAALMGRIGNL